MVHWEKPNIMLYIRIEFQVSSSPNVDSFIRIFTAPNIQNAAGCIHFIKKTTNVQLLHHLINPEIFDRIKTYQVHAQSRTCWKYNKNYCHSSYSWYFTEMARISKPIDSKFSSDEKQGFSRKRSTTQKLNW